ncbi:hypothetical protein [Metallococcus carri]|uniref:hypothetical protein n=1 Tax=Metallococcus carri TaxID=1656884 RepID=UPI002E2A1036|nr:hypothetical protein [Metallococcus carri]
MLATSSSTPVIESAWLADDVFVTTMGPKQAGRAEFDLDLIASADLVVTDSPEQLGAYDPPSLVVQAGAADRVLDLAQVAAGQVDLERAARTGRRVYLSVGMAGTEVQLLGHLAEGARESA